VKDDTRHPATGPAGRGSAAESASALVATGNPLAAEAARSVLAEGGSAIDAAIAADAVMGVVEPMATSIGGDLLAMIVPLDGQAIAYNGTGRAPAAFDATEVSLLPGGRIPERHPFTVTVPGAVRGWFDLHARYGRLPMARLLAPAIAAARDGFEVAPVSAREWAIFDKVLHADAASAKLYRAGSPPKAGERFANPELAAVLEAIARDGPSAYYEGEPARASSQAVRDKGGVLAPSDFAAHTGDFVEPLRATFRGLTVLECPPNTHGIAVLEALSALEPLDLDPDDPATVLASVRAMAEAAERAQKTVADPSGNTVCTVVVDAQGLAVTLMSSVFKRFGSGIAAPGCGFVLQNRGFGFSQPGHVNAPAPGKRPFHTVVPGAALADGRFRLGIGVVGGAMQPQGQLQILLRVAAGGAGLQDAVDAPRWRLEPGELLAIEEGTPAVVEKALREAGYGDPKGRGEMGGRSDFGGAQAVMRLPDGRLAGASDPRKDGRAVGL
jgi:gamma-glutamyltranspeptidase/glutathione hydrolase